MAPQAEGLTCWNRVRLLSMEIELATIEWYPNDPRSNVEALMAPH